MGNSRRFNYADVTSALAVFIALSTGSAWANHPGGGNTITTGDIVDGEVRSADITDSGINPVDIAPNSIPSTRLADGGVLSVDIADDAVKAANIAPNAIGTGHVANDSLNGSDIQEATLQGVDAATLDGRDLVEGDARVVSNRLTAPATGSSQPLLTLEEVDGQVLVACTAGAEVQFLFFNPGTDSLTVYTDRGFVDPERIVIGPGSFTVTPPNAGEERVIFQAAREEGANHDIATVTATGSGESPCPAAAQAIAHEG